METEKTQSGSKKVVDRRLIKVRSMGPRYPEKTVISISWVLLDYLGVTPGDFVLASVLNEGEKRIIKIEKFERTD